MNLAVYLPLLAACGVGAAAPAAARLARPAAGAILLATLAFIAAAGSTWALVLLAATLIDDVHPGPEAPVPDPVAATAVMILALSVVRLILLQLRRLRLQRGMRILPADPASVVVVADGRADAFAVPARWHPRAVRRHPGRIVVTSGMLDALDERQRRAMFAHERAHLDGGHHRLTTSVAVAAALMPALIPVRRAVAYLCERAADERAAAEVGDRGVVASAVAAAALARSGSRRGDGALAFDEFGVVERVAALGRPVPEHNRWLSAAAALAVAWAIVSADAHATAAFVMIVRMLLTN